MKKSKEYLKKFLLENYLDEKGDLLDLSGLDFSDFKGIIDISDMKVGGDLWQTSQTVNGFLDQSEQKVGKDLCQNYQTVHGDLFQNDQCVGEDLYQDYQVVDGELRQSYQVVKGDLEQYCQNVGGSFYTHNPDEDEIMEDIEFGYLTIKKSIDKTK